MLDHLTHPLKFKPYHSVKHLEGEGNWAISKYYKWPYRYFYRHKIRMIEMMLRDRRYRSAIDFGCGPAILVNQWHEYAEDVFLVDEYDQLPNKKVDLIICSSVMEFVDDLDKTFSDLAKCLEDNGDIVVASPMYSFSSEAYFAIINDRNKRHGHADILTAMSKHFDMRHYRTWLDLYFCAMGKKR